MARISPFSSFRFLSFQLYDFTRPAINSHPRMDNNSQFLSLPISLWAPNEL